MKRTYFILCALCVCLFGSAQNKKVETFDKNTWHWTEGVDKYQYVMVEDGFLVIQNLQKNKKATAYQQMAKSFARLPIRPQENFKLTIKYLVSSYTLNIHQIMFNTSKQCLEDDGVDGFESYMFTFWGLGGKATWMLNLGDGNNSSETLPGKMKVTGEYPMEFVIEKKSRKTSIELNGIQLYDGDLSFSNSCIGFLVPFFDKKISYIKIDEIIIEQADAEDD